LAAYKFVRTGRQNGSAGDEIISEYLIDFLRTCKVFAKRYEANETHVSVFMQDYKDILPKPVYFNELDFTFILMESYAGDNRIARDAIAIQGQATTVLLCYDFLSKDF